MAGLGQSPWYPQCPPFPDRGGRSSSVEKKECLGTCLIWGIGSKREYFGLARCGDW